MNGNEILLDMLGFGCASCAYTIEKMGRKIEGVREIRVNLAEQRIRVVHDGDRAAIIRQLGDVVRRIGHDIREHQPSPGA
jgi:cation transport ATPase